jgi:hypothetical protein
MRENSREKQRQSDLELAALLGEDFGLGEVRRTVRARPPVPVAELGGILALGAACAAIPAVFAFDAKVINAAVFGGLFLLGCLLAGLGTARSPVTERLFWYDGGTVQLNGDEPEPRVLRWADVETVIYGYESGGRSPAMLSRCILRGGPGTEPVDILCSLATGYPSKVMHRLLAETASVLAPRLVPPLIEIYESGEPVIVGRVRIDRAGITVGWPADRRITWSEVDSIAAYPLDRLTGIRTLYEIIIIDRSASTVRIFLGGVPNGMLLPHLLAYAAARNGILLHTQPADLLAPWQAISRSEARDG